MANVRVRIEHESSDLPHVRSLSVSARSSSIKTPIRALHLKRDTTSESRLIQNHRARGLNEIYCKLTKEKIEDIDNDATKLDDFGKNLRYIFTMPEIRDELNLLFFSYENKDRHGGKPDTVPNDEETAYLCNIVTHPQSEIIIPPFMPGLSGANYLEFLKNFFNHLESHMQRYAVMGSIPLVASTDLRDINQFYFERGINLFTVDFSNKYPMDAYILVNEIRQLTREISKEYKEDSFIHAFNVRTPKGRNSTQTALPAKDMITLASGFDSFGTSHKGDPMPPHVAQELKKKSEERRLRDAEMGIQHTPRFRLFNGDDYGYYLNDTPGLTDIFGNVDRHSIRLSDLSNDSYTDRKLKGLRKAYNVERQAVEANEYRTLIKENSLRQHIMQKEHIRESFERTEHLLTRL